MSTKVFNFSMCINVLHIAGLSYLNNAVTGQPELFYWIVRILICVYGILSLILILSELGKYITPPPPNGPKKHP